MRAKSLVSFPRTAFKAYDIRGRVPEELDEQLAYRIGRAVYRAVPYRNGRCRQR